MDDLASRLQCCDIIYATIVSERGHAPETLAILLDRMHARSLGLTEESMVQGPERHAILLDHTYVDFKPTIM